MQEVMQVILVVVDSMTLDLLEVGKVTMILETELHSLMWGGLAEWRMITGGNPVTQRVCDRVIVASEHTGLERLQTIMDQLQVVVLWQKGVPMA
jgi:hypothetical protein